MKKINYKNLAILFVLNFTLLVFILFISEKFWPNEIKKSLNSILLQSFILSVIFTVVYFFFHRKDKP
jgi:phosphoglycerol transferase MdoB-like AlkP superfamily enzyme